MSLAAAAVRRPVATTMVLLATVLLGTVSLWRMELTLLPEVQDESISVWVPYPDAGVPEIELAVVRPVEDALVAVRGVGGVRSEVVPGGATVSLRLAPGTDAALATLGVRERLEALRWELPEGVGRPIVQGGTSQDRPALVLALAASDLEAAARWAETVLRPRLEQTEGVARAQVQGAPTREIRVVPDPARLQATGIDAQAIASALGAANVTTPGGALRRRGIRYSVRFDSELRTAADIAAVVVGGTPEHPVRVRDVARVEDGIAPPDGWSRQDGAPAVGLLVYPEAGANLLRTSSRVHARLAELAREFPEFQVAVIQDSSPYVRQSLSNLWQAVWLGGLLAFGVLLYFLGDLRSPALLMTTLPVAVLGSFAVLHALGITLNILSLGGIALSVGTLVDNSIICLDNIHRLRSRGVAAARAAAEGAREVALPMLASTLTTLSVFVPLAAVPGKLGTLFRDQAVAVAVSQVVSLLVSMTLLPMLSARLGSPRRGAARLPLYGAYHRLLCACLRRPLVFLGVLVAVWGTSVAGLLHLPREILPEVGSQDLELGLRVPPGSDVTTTDAAALEVETWLGRRPEVLHIHATVGAAGTIDPAAARRELNQALLRVRLASAKKQVRRALLDSLAATFGERLDLAIEVPPARAELAAAFLPSAPTLTCEIAGPDPKRSFELAERVLDSARRSLPGSPHRLRLRRDADEPRYAVALDDGALWRQGVDGGRFLRALRARTSGFEATRLRREDTEDPVVVRESDAARPDAGAVVVDGRTYPVRALATTRTELAPGAALRIDQARVASLEWDGSLGGVAAVQAALAAAVASVGLPPGYSARYGGAYSEMRTTLRSLGRVFAFSAGLVFLILAAQFESVRLPLVVFTDIPLAVIGVALGLGISGGSLNAMSGVGMVILNGIVVNDSILKVDLLRRLQSQGMGRLRAILVTSRRHYRPIWMTTTTTVLGLVPLFFGTGSELMSALAAAVIGGLFVSTILTLLVVPVIFHFLAGSRIAPAREGSA